MNLTTVFLLAICLSANAKVFSQRVSLSEKNVSLEKIFKEITRQTGYTFVYTKSLLKKSKDVSINVQNAPVEKSLDICFKEQPLTYTILNTMVIIKEKETVVPKEIIYTPPPTAMIPPPITGKVTDDKGQPLEGATVLVKGAQTGTKSDANGNFSIDAEPNSTLVISYVGFESTEVNVGNRTNISVQLKPSVATGDEVVVVGYGTQKKSDVTGSISTVTSAEINAVPAANVMEALAGRAPGVQVKQNNGSPGAPISVRIRGTNSIVGNNEPLYVVDGFPVSNALSINNSSIESIEILKDASAVAIYGSRASNGVVLITTKKGKVGETKVTFEGSWGYQELIKKMEMMNPKEYGIYYNVIENNNGRGDLFSEDQIKSFAAMGKGTDWQDVVFKKAPIQNYSINVSGGDRKTRFSVMAAVFDQEGIIKNSDYKRFSLNSNIRHNISKRLSVDVILSLSKNASARQLSEQGRFGTSLIGRAYGIPSYLKVYEEDGSYLEPVLHDPRVSEALWNPLNYINETSNKLAESNVLANAVVSYEIFDGLSFKVSAGIESRNSRVDAYQTKEFQDNTDGVASVNTSEFTSLLNENILSYDRTFNFKHRLSAIAGWTFQNFLNTSLSAGGRGFLSDVTETYSLASAAVPSIPGSGYSQSTLLSGLGRVNYSYDNRYLLTVSFRADGSSVYSPGNKWGYFPSAAFSWRLSKEKFINLKNTSISDLRLKASWGRAGSQAINPYSTMNQLIPGTTVFGGSLYTAMSPGAGLASDLKWETTEQSNFGLELILLNGRLEFTADYYFKKTSDLLNAVQLPRSTGFTNSLRNVGDISNKGFEFQINSKVFDKEKFRWDLDANISFNRSKVLKLYGGQDILAGQLDMIIFRDFANTYREGKPMGIVYGYQEHGYDENGLLQYVDQNNDGKIDVMDKVKIGDPNPNFIFGINSNMSYRNFTLSMFFTGSQGNDIINMSAVAYTVDNTNGTNKLKAVFNNYWTPENPNAKYLKPSTTNNYLFSDRYVEDGSYLRLRNIELGYNLPFKRWVGIQNAQIYVSGQNLLTLTDYSWLDPDVNTQGGSNSLNQGIDYSGYPSTKSLTIGVRVNFQGNNNKSKNN